MRIVGKNSLLYTIEKSKGKTIEQFEAMYPGYYWRTNGYYLTPPPHVGYAYYITYMTKDDKIKYGLFSYCGFLGESLVDKIENIVLFIKHKRIWKEICKSTRMAFIFKVEWPVLNVVDRLKDLINKTGIPRRVYNIRFELNKRFSSKSSLDTEKEYAERKVKQGVYKDMDEFNKVRDDKTIPYGRGGV